MAGLRRLVLAATLAAGALAGAPAAHAGTYTVHSCTDSVTAKALGDVDGWNVVDSHPGENNYVAAYSCGADGGSLTVTPAQATDGGSIPGSDSSPRSVQLRFIPPAGTYIKSYELWRAMHVDGYRAFIVSRQHDRENAETCNASFTICRIGDLGAPLTGANRVAKDFGAGVGSYISLQLLCNGSGCVKQRSAATVRLFASKVVLEEVERPTFNSPPAGTLLAPGEVSGTRTLDLVAADTGSGVRRMTITSSAAGPDEVLSSHVLDSGTGHCAAERFTKVQPCPKSIYDTLQIDTKRFPDGPQTITIQIEDAAGNTRSVTRDIDVHNAPASTAEPSIGGFDGQIAAGDTLSCAPGAFSPEPDEIRFAWLVDGAVVAGQANPTYVVRTQDVGRPIVCRVTAVRGGGSTVVDSDPVGGSGQPGGAPAPSPTPGSGSGGTGGSGGGGTATPSSGPSTSTTTTTTTNTTNVYLGPPNNGANASNRARVSISGSRKRRVRFGRSVRSSITLRDEQGRPISGARVTVLQRMKVPGAPWVPAREPLTTDADGRLSWRVPAGYSRTIRYAYKANLDNTEFQAVSDLVLVVKSKSSLKTSGRSFRNGQAVRFSGRLKSRPVPVGGVLIDLQAKVGNRWQTFMTTRSKRSGRWAASYRFRATRGLQTYAFRARVRQDTGYPYALSTTRTVKVKVQG